MTAYIPDHDHYKGSASGRVFPLWKDAAATQPNISSAVVAAVSKAYGTPVDPVDIFAYIAAVLACPSYTAMSQADLVQPGLRVPLTADATLFAEAVEIGRQVVWLHTFGERFAEGRPAGAPRVAADHPTVTLAGKIPTTSDDYPDTISYDPTLRRLRIGNGYVENVTAEVWGYEVSGKPVLKQWFSYRKLNRERPQIGDRRPPSPLADIQPDHWLPEYTTELIKLINVLALLVLLQPDQADVLNRIIHSPLIEIP